MENKKKIIILGPGYPYRNGQSIYLSHLCTQLAQKYNIELINFSMLYPGFLFPGKTQYDESSSKKLTFPNNRMINSLNPLSWFKTAQYINKQNPDIIAIDWWHPFFGICMRGITLLLNRRNKKKIIFITENVISHEANAVDKLLTKIGLKYASGFLALSESVELFLKTMFKKKVFRSALPIYDFYKDNHEPTVEARNTYKLKNKLGFGNDDIVLLFFGLVRKYKGLDILIESFGSVAGKYENVKLLVVGEFYEDPAPYYDLIKKLNISDKVHLENRYIPNEEVDSYFKISDCVVLPYRSATQSGILSMAYGFRKPVIVTDVGELGAWVREGATGYVVKSNKESLEDGIIQFLLEKDTVHYPENIEKVLQEKDIFQNVDRVFEEMIEFVHAQE
jgi:glycosyltransferase involved in cell wall biosynthesis